MWGFLYLEPYIFGEKPNSNDHSPNSDGELQRGMSDIKNCQEQTVVTNLDLVLPYRTTEFNEDLNKRPKSKNSISKFYDES